MTPAKQLEQAAFRACIAQFCERRNIALTDRQLDQLADQADGLAVEILAVGEAIWQK